MKALQTRESGRSGSGGFGNNESGSWARETATPVGGGSLGPGAPTRGAGIPSGAWRRGAFNNKERRSATNTDATRRLRRLNRRDKRAGDSEDNDDEP